MRYIVCIFISLFMSCTSAQDVTDLVAWDKECNEKACMFFYDVFHQGKDKREAITIAIAVDVHSKKINFMSVHYPPAAESLNGGRYAFVTSTLEDGKYQLHPRTKTMTQLPFTGCDKESCVIRFTPAMIQEKFGYSLEDELMRGSHIWFLYTIQGEPIRALAALLSFKKQMKEM